METRDNSLEVDKMDMIKQLIKLYNNRNSYFIVIGTNEGMKRELIKAGLTR